ncbi:MAG: hypothetical protein AB7T49_10470 [Oligoflexales bacterium]
MTAVLAFMMLGCQTYETQVSPKQAAIRHINQQQYEEAISILVPLVNEEPDNAELRILLASSYVGSAGFDVIESFGFFIKFVNDLNEEGTKLQDRQVPKKTFDSLLVGFMADYVEVLEQISKIPYLLDDEKRNQINEALIHLQSIPRESDFFLRARFYSAYLNVFQYLNFIRDAIPDFSSNKKSNFRGFVCKVNIAVLVQNMDKSSGYLIQGLEDARVALESRKKPLPNALNAAATTAKSLQDVIRTYQVDALSSLATSAINELKPGLCN